MNSVNCPFDGASMNMLNRQEAASRIISMLVSPRSNISNLLKGAVGKGDTPGSVKECGSCGFVAIFSK